MYKKALYLQIDAELHSALRASAENEKMSIREIVEKALEKYLRKFKKKPNYKKNVLESLKEFQVDTLPGVKDVVSDVDKIVYGLE